MAGLLLAKLEVRNQLTANTYLLRACLKLSRLEHALEAHAGHEQRGEHAHVPRGVGARLVVDPQAAVALQAAEGLLDLPAPLLELEARAAPDPDDLGGDAVAVQEGLGLLPGCGPGYASPASAPAGAASCGSCERTACWRLDVPAGRGARRPTTARSRPSGST